MVRMNRRILLNYLDNLESAMKIILSTTARTSPDNDVLISRANWTVLRRVYEKASSAQEAITPMNVDSHLFTERPDKYLDLLEDLIRVVAQMRETVYEIDERSVGVPSEIWFTAASLAEQAKYAAPRRVVVSDSLLETAMEVCRAILAVDGSSASDKWAALRDLDVPGKAKTFITDSQSKIYGNDPARTIDGRLSS